MARLAFRISLLVSSVNALNASYFVKYCSLCNLFIVYRVVFSVVKVKPRIVPVYLLSILSKLCSLLLFFLL